MKHIYQFTVPTPRTAQHLSEHTYTASYKQATAHINGVQYSYASAPVEVQPTSATNTGCTARYGL